MNILWKDWCWSWNYNSLATWHEELTHLKRPWCWARLKAGREGNDREWDGWMASLTQWTWVQITLGVGNWQGGLVCCSPWGGKELDTSERPDWLTDWRHFVFNMTMTQVWCIFPGRYFSWSQAKWKSLSHVRFFVTLWTMHSMEFSRPEYWSG